MKMFSDCSGSCLLCAGAGGGCLAGHGDDDYTLASKEQVLLMLKTKRYGGDLDNRALSEGELLIIEQTLKKYYDKVE